MTPQPLPDRLLAFRDAAESTKDDEGNDGRATYVPVSLQTFRQTMEEAAAALSGREAVAHRWKRDGEVVGPWIDGTPTENQLKAMDACAPVAAWTYELAYSAPPTPQPGDGVVVPREDVSLAAQMLTWGMEEGLTVKQEEDVRQQAEKLFAYAAAPSAKGVAE